MKYFLIAAFFIGAFGLTSVHAQTQNKTIKQAINLIELGNPEEAIDLMNGVISAQPKNYEALATLAIAQLAMGNVSGAEKNVEIAYDLERKNILVRNARGLLFGKQRKKEDALKEFNQAIKYDDKEVFSYVNLSRYFLTLDSLKSAEITLYKAQGVAPNDVRPYLGLAELYEKQRVTDLAIKQYEDAKKLNPNDVTVLAKLARLYFRARKYTESANEWIKLTRIDSTYAQAYYEIGNLFLMGEQCQRAIPYSEKFLTFKPEDIKGNWLLARALVECNQYAKALPYLEIAAKNDSLRPLTELFRARAYFASRDFAKANNIFTDAKYLDPNDMYYYGISLISAGDTLGGLEKWKASLVGDTIRTDINKQKLRDQIIGMYRAIKKDERAADYQVKVAEETKNTEDYIKAGQLYTSAGKSDEASDAFNKALAINPASVNAMIGLADLIVKDEKKMTDASQMLEKASASVRSLEDKESVGNGYARLGVAFTTQKNFQKALEPLTTSLKYLTAKSQYFCTVNLLIASAQIQLKQMDKARDPLKKVLEVCPNNKDAKELQKYLDSQKSGGTAPSKKGK
jgi:tetratricopeptide (TPR) repeat protein